MAKSEFRFCHQVRVRWAECDPQGIAYNGAYLAWLEATQAEYWRNLGFRFYLLGDLGLFDTVMVKLSLEFNSPARLDDLLELRARVLRMGASSFTMECAVYRAGGEELLARMESVYVSYDRVGQRGRPIPEEVRRLFERFEATGERLPLAQTPGLAQAAVPPADP
jgi:acyl-CoA thioester hydrolase